MSLFWNAPSDTILDPKRAYLRRRYTSTKKPHYTEGWVEFKDKKVARSVAAMLNAQPIGGKKRSRWRDDVWTMKYLPKFKWNMLTEQIGKWQPFLHC
jgi:ESF2/ABP1 family protein